METLAVGGLDTRTAVVSRSIAAPADWTVFCFGANDAAPWKQVPLDEFERNYETLLRRANSDATLVLGPAPVADSWRPGARTSAAIARYATTAATVAQRCGAAFIALGGVLGPDDLADDGVHLNDRGYDTLERLVIGTFEPARPGDG